MPNPVYIVSTKEHAVDPKEHDRLISELRERGLDVVGLHRTATAEGPDLLVEQLLRSDPFEGARIASAARSGEDKSDS